MKKLLMLSTAACVLLSGAVCVQAQQTTTTKKTVILGHSTADGSSNITEKPLEECIVSLPSPKDVVVSPATAKDEYLKGINGEEGKNAWTKVYSATASVSFRVRQKFLLIVTTKSIEGKDPVMEEKARETILTKTFASDSGEGDIFAGRSNRKHYYSTAEAAEANVKKQAEAWILQQQQALCTAGAEK